VQGSLLFGAVNQRAFLLQGYGPQVYAAYQLLKLVDVPPEAPDQQIRVQRLYNAAAEELEPILNDILNDKTRGPRAPAAGVSGAEIAGQQVQLKILAHSALNSLILSGSKDQLFEAQDLIARLDVPVEQIGGDYSIMRMQNVLSKDLQTTLARFINEDQQAETQAASGTGAPGAGAQQRRTRKTVVISHDESNSLILSGTATKLKQLKGIIEGRLDARQPQVLVECAVIELTTNDLMKLGFELAFLDTKANGNYTRPFGYTSFGLSAFQDTDGNGLPDTRLPDFTNPLQGVTGGIISGGDFGIPVLMNALSSDTRANVLSLPSVVVNNNQNAAVTTTEDRPTTTSQQGTATTSNSFSGFQGAGITLNISPSISSNNYLRLNIDLQVSRFLTPFDPAASVPGVKTTRQVKTQVTMPSGSTMVLGGVIEDKEADSKAGIPFLKDIPILGWFFSNASTEKAKTNLYFFLTPHILDETISRTSRTCRSRRSSRPRSTSATAASRSSTRSGEA
jgi:general secretion pathway protein D